MRESLRRQQASIQLQLSRQEQRQHGKAQNSSQSRSQPQTPVGWLPNSPSYCAPVDAEDLNPQINLAAAQHGVSSDLLRAVAHIESGFSPCAKSTKGAQGLMQIMPTTGRDLGLVDPWDSQQSLLAGAKYLRQLLDRYNGNVRLALGAYNAGPARVDRYGDVPPIEETRAYVQRIMAEFSTSDIRAVEEP